jgi:hypothetical protein
MKRYIKFLIIIIPFLLSCRERNSQYDVLAEGFTPPPPVCATASHPVYDPNTGNLVEVDIGIWFTEPFAKTLGITHIFYAGGSPVDSAGFVIDVHTDFWAVGIYSSGQFPVGDYCLKLFFGGFPIAGHPFSVVDSAGKSVIKEIARTVPTRMDLGEQRLRIGF